MIPYFLEFWYMRSCRTSLFNTKIPIRKDAIITKRPCGDSISVIRSQRYTYICGIVVLISLFIHIYIYVYIYICACKQESLRLRSPG